MVSRRRSRNRRWLTLAVVTASDFPFGCRATPVRARAGTRAGRSAALERVAGGGPAGVLAARQPARALGGGAVRPGLRRERGAGAPALEVVADDGRCVEDVAHVVAGELAGAGDRVEPDAGVAVGLQLDADRSGVVTGRVRHAQRVDLRQDAELLLDVVAHLVADDVARGEGALEAEPAPEGVEE